MTDTAVRVPDSLRSTRCVAAARQEVASGLTEDGSASFCSPQEKSKGSEVSRCGRF